MLHGLSHVSEAARFLFPPTKRKESIHRERTLVIFACILSAFVL